MPSRAAEASSLGQLVVLLRERSISYFRAQFPSIPVLVLTGYPDTEGAADLCKRGVSDHLTKPIESHRLAAAVDRLARNHVYADPFIV